MNVKTTIMLISLFASSVCFSGAGEPLSVIYAETDDEGPIVESQQNYIDNQSYLKEFERRRMERVLESEEDSSVIVVTGSYRSLPNFTNWQQDDTRSSPDRFFGFEYQSGNTVFRYYDGYQPNCCVPVYIVRPHPKPPIAVPYHYPVSGRNR